MRLVFYRYDEAAVYGAYRTEYHFFLHGNNLQYEFMMLSERNALAGLVEPEDFKGGTGTGGYSDADFSWASSNSEDSDESIDTGISDGSVAPGDSDVRMN